MIYKNIIDDNQVQDAVKLLTAAEQGSSTHQTLDYNYILAKKWVV